MPPIVRIVEPGPRWSIHPSFLAEPGSRFVIRWDTEGDDAVKQRVEFSPDGNYDGSFQLVANDLPSWQRSYEWVVPDPGFAVTYSAQFIRVVATDGAGQEGMDIMPLTVPSPTITGALTITTDLSGQTFLAGQAVPDMNWTGAVTEFPNVTPLIVLENDGAAIAGFNAGSSSTGTFFSGFPFVSTDRARLALRVNGNSNNLRGFFKDGYFSIRHDPRLGFTPPTVTLTEPVAGATFAGGTIVPVRWSGLAPEGLHSFTVLASYDAGRTWHEVVRELPGTATQYDWQLQPSAGIADVRVRVVARDRRFQNSSADGKIVVTPGTGTCQPDLGFAGPGNVHLTVCGDALASGGMADLRMTGAPGGAISWLVAGLLATPTPFYGGTLVPVPPILTVPFIASGVGEAALPGIAGGGGVFSLNVQFAVVDSSHSLGFALSNAVRIEFLP